MKLLNKIYNIAKADFLERIRRTSFLIILGLTIWASNIFIPPINALTGMHLRLGGYRGLYNSAWIGTSVTLCTVLFMSLFGFYLVKNSVARDTTTKVGQIIATTPIKNSVYLLGKLFSNFAVLSLIVIVTAISAGVLQLIRGEVMQIQLWNLISPFLFIALPSMFVVSAIAVLFECIPLLKGALGNILYFLFVWMVLVTQGTVRSESGIVDNTVKILDPMGLSIPIQSMTPTIKSVYPQYNGGFSASFTTLKEPLKVFVWNGTQWNNEQILVRLMWIAISVILVCTVSLFFRRFDSSYIKSRQKKISKSFNLPEKICISRKLTNNLNASNLTSVEKNFSLLRILKSELILTIKSCSRWLLIIIIALILLCLVSPMEAVRGFLFPALILLPIPLWADLGSREKKYNTMQLIFSAPYSIKYQLTARWMSGIIITLIITITSVLRVSTTLDISALISILSCAVFVPTLALVCGIWTGNSRFFELLYTTLWYLGPFNKMPILDYTHLLTNSQNTVFLYFALTALMLFLSIIGRKRQTLYN